MHERRWVILYVLCGSLVITALDNTIVNVALPSMQEELDATTAQLQWVIDAYSVLFAGALLLAGALGDRFGRRRMLVIGLAIFTIGSLAAAWSTEATTLAFWRAVMGVGGACIMPSTLSILVQTFPDRTERTRAVGIWAAFAGVGIALGPIVGGLLLEHFAWPSVFLVNPPLTIVMLIATMLLVPESSDPARPQLDLLGAGLSALGLVALVVTIIQFPEQGLGTATAASGLAAIVLLGGFVAWERRAVRPLLPMTMFSNRVFSTSIVIVALTYFALSSMMFFLPQFLQLVEGFTPLQSGLLILPAALALVAASITSPRIAERVGSRRMVVLGLATITVGLVAASFDAVHTQAWYVVGTLVLVGGGMGMALPHATSGVLSAVPSERAGMGSAVNDAMGEIGGALGVAVLGAVLSASYRSQIDDAIARAGDALAGVPDQALEATRESLAAAELLIPRLPTELVEPARQVVAQSFISGMTLALCIGAGFTLVGVLLARFRLPKHMAQVDE